MASQVGNTAENLQPSDIVDEPSMEEILASIKQIIAEDEVPKDGLTERERYTHPDNPSNSNETKAAELVDDSAMQQAMEAELQLVADQLDVPEPQIEEPVAQAQVAQQPSGMDAASAFASTVVTDSARETLQERAAKLRAELAQAKTAPVAEERLDEQRVRGKMHLETLVSERMAANKKIAEEARVKTEEQSQILADKLGPTMGAEHAQSSAPAHNAAPAMGHVNAAPAPAMPTTEAIATQMAETMLREKSADIQAQIAEIIRPTIRKWLSDNLPSLVEKMVREEIEAVSNGSKKA